VTLNQRGGSATSGKQGIGGIALPISTSGTGHLTDQRQRIT